MSDDLEKAWVKYGALCGLSSVGIYLLLNVLVNIPGLPLSPVATRTAFFSVGVLGVASVGGVYHLIKKHKNSVMLQMAVLLSIVAFAFLTLMAVVQETTAVFWEESLANVESTADINSIWRAIDSVQLGIDITFDIFYATAFILYSILMFRHPRFGKLFGITGVVFFSALLLMNLFTFPHPPASKGFIDFGPITGLWGLAVVIQSLRSVKWMER